MTTQQTIVWTPLPNGVRNNLLQLSVFVSPRLKTDEGLPKPILEQFPDFLDWPAKTIDFQVQFAEGTPMPATRVGDPPRSDLWTALFKETSHVRPYEFASLVDPKLKDLRLYDASIPIHSYPIRSVLSFIKEQYLRVGTATPTELPSTVSLAHEDAFGKIGFGAVAGAAGKVGTASAMALAATGIPSAGAAASKGASLIEELHQIQLQMRAIPPGPPDPPKDFMQAQQYYAQQTPNPGAIANVVAPEVDFHQMLAALNNYPKLLRLLGLVHDLVVGWPAGIPKLAVPVRSTVKVLASWSPQQPAPDVSCRTSCLIGATTFQAAPRQSNPELSRGFLRLSDKSKYEVVQLDVDGAIFKSLDFASSLLRAAARLLPKSSSKPAAEEADDVPDSSATRALPSLRSAGISIAKVGRARDLAVRWDLAAGFNARLEKQQEVVLDAEDVVRGYYVDIWDDSAGKWRSLCKRHGKYHFLDASGLPIEVDDEGAVVAGVTRKTDGPSPAFFVHESLFRWAGWSLVAPRPGKTIKADGTVERIEDNKARTAFRLEATFSALPGSLPRLRYGRTYRIRARAADLAGNGVDFGAETSKDFSLAAGPITYVRFEPVASPVVVLRQPLTEGESLERLVIRSNYNTPASATAAAERYVAPPKIAQLMAEEHGLFDPPAGLDKPAYDLFVAKTYDLIVQKESATFSLDQPVPDADKAPYLPDPLARGAAWRGLPGTGAGSVFKETDFAYAPEGWPEARAFRLVVREPASHESGAPAWDAGQRVLTVKLPKGDVARVRLSSFLNQAGLAVMGGWQWQQRDAGLPPKKIGELRNHATAGSQWQLTPARELVLVHAVRQPLVEPKFQNLSADRKLGDTFATMKDTMAISRKSTIRVDVLAEWTEPIDALAEPTWKSVSGKAQPFQVHVAAPGARLPDEQLAINHRHEFGDTKYREVFYSAVATTRFSEYFRQRRRITLTSLAGVQLTTAGIVPGSEVVKAADGSVTYERDADYWMGYERGYIFRLATGKIPASASLDVAYLEPPLTRQTSTPTKVDVLSSARPATPKVLYAIPTFGWQTSPANDKIVSQRAGGGLRVYLDRPWYSSGAGELLGIVLWPELVARGKDKYSPLPPDPKVDVPNELKPYVTQWGIDPIWSSRPTYQTPVLADFKTAKEKATGLSLDELPDVTVAVAGHEVAYDEERRLWYCDIQIDAGDSYFPFVRLALARFQPKSIKDAHLSRVVLADFAQLAPNRSAAVTFDPKNPKRVTVAVAGLSYQQSAAGKGPGPVAVTVETRRPDVAGELGWVPAPNFTYSLGVTPSVSVTPGTSGTLVRSGEVLLPAARGSQPMRLVIREFEWLPADGVLGVAIPQQRLVYADVVEI